MNEPIEFEVETNVITIPDGDPLVVPVGMGGMVVQVLGGNFTIRLETGHLVRVMGQDAANIGCELIDEDEHEVDLEGELEDQVWAQLRTCYDPEIPANIVDLGLIYGLALEDLPDEPDRKRVKITMTLTAPGCGMGQILRDDVEGKLRGLPLVGDVDIDLVFEPPWGPDRMSDEARFELGLY